jgi:hypothetical protein
MANQYSEIVSYWKDENLIRLVELEPEKYPELQVLAAKIEIGKRGLLIEDFSDFISEQIKIRTDEYNKGGHIVSKQIRIIHSTIDIFGCYILLGVFAFFFGFLFDYFVPLLVLGSFFTYYVTMEYFFQQTLGKIFTGSKVVMTDGSKPVLKSILIRTCCRLIPLEPLSFLSSEIGLHDSLSDTRVVRKNYRQHQL